jgi:hypothetical protein
MAPAFAPHPLSIAERAKMTIPRMRVRSAGGGFLLALPRRDGGLIR